MMKFQRAGELVNAVGMTLGTTEWRQITQSCVDTFATLTGDQQWIHVDRQRAKSESSYGDTIVHGAFVLALVPTFLSEILHVCDARMIVNVGVDRARFRRPMRVGSCLRLTGVLNSAEYALDGVISAVRVSIDADDTQSSVCTAEQRIFFHG